MTGLVVKEQDLPVGTTRESLQKTIRLKKSEAVKKGQWGTPVEIEYKNLIMTITNAQVSQLGLVCWKGPANASPKPTKFSYLRVSPK